MIVRHNLDLRDYNSYKVHSIAALALFPESVNDILEILSKYDMSRVYVVGKGCNTIFAKEYYPDSQPILFIRDNFSGIERCGKQIRVLSGTDLKKLSIYAMENSLAGLEYFFDIPGCLGGAVTMNAGSCGVSITDYISSIKYVDTQTSTINEVKVSELSVGYRESVFKASNNYIILECTFELPEGEKGEILQKMNEIVCRREAKQPRDLPNAGSVFIRPAENVYVGPMIENLRLKGYRVGGAEVSRKHAGFIVNADNATGKDIVELIEYIKSEVKKTFNIELQTEQRILL